MQCNKEIIYYLSKETKWKQLTIIQHNLTKAVAIFRPLTGHDCLVKHLNRIILLQT